MDVSKADAVTPAGQSGPRKEEKRGAEKKQENEKEANGQAGGAAAERPEAFAVDGLLAGNLSPEVQKAFEGLSSQIEPLRAEVERARGREAHFKELAETHSFLPLPGRREFIRELAHVTQNMENLSSPPSLVLFHLVNADDVRRRLGRKALDALLIHVCAAIETALQPTDVAGSLGGNDFAIILLDAGPNPAQARAGKIIEAIRKQPFPWQGETIIPEVIAGVAALQDNIEPEAAIGDADGDLIGGDEAPPAPGPEPAEGE